MSIPAILFFCFPVVIDRKLNKNCNTGRFELAYKQPHISTLTYTGVSLAVLGHAVAKPSHKESCIQKRNTTNNAPANGYSLAVQQMSDNTASDSSQPSSNFSMLGVKDLLNNILFYNRNQVKPITRSSSGSASPRNFLYTIPPSLKQANSAGPMQRKNIQNKRTAVKAKHDEVAQTHKPSTRDKSKWSIFIFFCVAGSETAPISRAWSREWNELCHVYSICYISAFPPEIHTSASEHCQKHYLSGTTNVLQILSNLPMLQIEHKPVAVHHL